MNALRNWRSPGILGVAVFGFSFLYLYWVGGDVLRVAGDEGIYLQGGRLVALGQQPYRDFFAITGPLTFWLEGLLARAGGMSLAVMRLPPIFDAAFLAFAVYYLTSRYAGRLYSIAAAAVFLAYETRLRQLNVNHRWDSAALSMGAILLARYAEQSGRRRVWPVAGFLLVAAVCATPSMVVVGAAFLFWCFRRSWRDGLVFLSGAAGAAAIVTAYLQSQHVLLALIRAMQWNGANYAQANRVIYGGTPVAPLHGWPEVAGFIFSLVPAILPPAALAGWLLYLRRPGNRPASADMLPLLVVSAALVCAGWPRWTADTLLHTLALPWFLGALLLYRLTSPGQQRRLAIAALMLASISVGFKTVNAMDYESRETRVGNVRAPLDESEFLAGLERHIQPGDTLFSYPYLASAYDYLDARNPTYYSFLQPGMMTQEDERRAIAELDAAPPRWLIYENFPPEVVLAIWPGSDPSRVTMAEVSSYLHAHFHPADSVSGPWGHVEVMENNAAVHVP